VVVVVGGADPVVVVVGGADPVVVVGAGVTEVLTTAGAGAMVVVVTDFVGGAFFV
jgi:hypothetical protein